MADEKINTDADVAGPFAAVNNNDPEAVREDGGHSDPEVADYRDLQAQAKEAGIPANQSADELREQIAAETDDGQEA